MLKAYKTKKLISAACIGIAINLILFIVKLYIGLSSNSIAIYADSLNNMLDCAVCVIAAIGFCILTAKHNENYPFGFGKTEDILNFVVSVIISLTGMYFAYISFERFMYPAPVWYSIKYAVIVSVTVIVKLALALIYRAINKNLNSSVLKALYIDSLLDLFITASTLISFTLSNYVNFSIDGITGIAIGIFLAVQGIKMVYSVCCTLLGKRNPVLCDSVKNSLLNDSGSVIIKDIQCHCYGDKNIFTVTLISTDYSAKNMIEINQAITKAEETFNAQIYIKYEVKE